jgi:hypothetical protein
MSIAIGVHNIASRQELDQLIESANAENKRVIITLGQQGREVRVLKKENRLSEFFRRVSKQVDRENNLVAEYRNLLNVISIREDSEGQAPRLEAQSQASQALQDSIARQSQAPTFGQIEAAPQIQVASAQAPTTPVPKLGELIAWYRAKTNYDLEKIAPGFWAMKYGEFIAITSDKVKQEIIQAAGGLQGRHDERPYEKAHLSIDRAQFNQAWDKLAPILFSDKNPFYQYKLSSLVDDGCLQKALDGIHQRDLPRSEAEELEGDVNRVSEGLQITFYITPKTVDTSDEQFAKEVQDAAKFMKEIDDVMQEFAPGKVYGRTIQMTPRIDFRHEGLMHRGDTRVPVQELLANEPWPEEGLTRVRKSSPFFCALEKEFKPQATKN